MSRWFDGIGMGALALSLAGMFAGCGGGGDGGGGNGLRLFFGMAGDGSCTSVIVEVDLADAGAILARDNDGTVDCSLDTVLTSNGCDVTFTELDDGDRLRVTITGCTIPESTNLFACSFDDVDLSELNAESSAQCACTVPGCDGTPPLCIDEDSVPQSCESCVNGTDDDDDGLVDCEDPNCENSPSCVSSTTSTTSTTSVSDSSTTTSSTLPEQPLIVTFVLASAEARVSRLELTVNYASAPGQFVGTGEDVECRALVDDVVFAPEDKDSIRRLALSLRSLGGVRAPTDLVACEFDPDTPVPVPANFTVVVNDAADPDGERIDVEIDVTVTQAP